MNSNLKYIEKDEDMNPNKRSVRFYIGREPEEDHQQEEAAAAHHGQEHQRGHTLQHLCVDKCRYV